MRLWWALPLVGVACTGAGDPEPAGNSVKLGWIAVGATSMDAISSELDARRDGWAALHRHDYDAAVDAFSTASWARARARWDQSLLHRDLANLSADAHESLFQAWQTRGPLPPAAAAIATWSAACNDRDATQWSALVSESDPGYLLVKTLAGEAGDEPQDALTARFRSHEDGDSKAFRQAAATPVLRLMDETVGVERSWYDPCVHDTLSDAWLAEAVRDLGGDDWRAARQWTSEDIGGSFLAPWLDAESLTLDLEKVQRPGLIGAGSAAYAGLSTRADLPGDGDDPQAARDEVRAVSEALDEAIRIALDSATDDAEALTLQLQLPIVWRTRWLVVQSRRALDAGRPRQALAYAERARDATKPVGPTHPPSAAVLTAHAYLLLGRTREALDALHAVDDAVPEASGLVEVAGDLAVLQGLDRAGDSKEN